MHRAGLQQPGLQSCLHSCSALQTGLPAGTWAACSCVQNSWQVQRVQQQQQGLQSNRR